MEPRGCNRWQPVANRLDPEAPKEAKTVAAGCDRLPQAAHGKEGVDGSSQSEGSAKAAQIAAFVLDFICTISSVRQVWNRLWSSQVRAAS
jgi:hypothetical protein